jgi:ribonuclease HI
MMRNLNTAITAVRIISKPIHTILPFCVGKRIIDEHAIRPQTPKPLFIRTAKYFYKLKLSPHYYRPP